MKQERRTYQCQAAGRLVTLTRQTFHVAGIGDQAPARQHGHGCTEEQACPHRYTDACRVQQLNR